MYIPHVPPKHLESLVYDDENHAEALMEELHELYFSGKIDAKILGSLAWRLQQLNIKEAEPFALAPTTINGKKQQTGKYQRKLDAAYHFDYSDADLYPLQTPLRNHITGEREKDTIWLQPIHESLAKELDDLPELVEEWENTVGEPGSWIPAYEEHPAVQGASNEERKSLFPIAVYMDATKFLLRDSLLVMTVHLLFSTQRHLVFAVPKSSLCDCGCSGWCSLFPIYVAIYWSLMAALQGLKPTKRHDGDALDAARTDVAGQLVRYKFVVLDYAGDWSEIATRWAFPSWSATLGCFLCRSSQAQLRDATHIVATKPADEYFDDAARCEVWVVVNTMQLRMAIRFSLIDDGPRKGRVLKSDESPWIRLAGLRKFDRLEPTQQLLDVHDFDKKTIPFMVKFWRIPPVSELTVHHRHPLLCKELGTSLLTFGLDTLHGLHIGIYPAWITRVLHLLLEADIFQTRQTRHDDHIKASALAMMADLRVWYNAYEATLPPHSRGSFTRIQCISASQLGSGSDAGHAGFVSFKAQETRWLQPYVLHLLRKHRERFLQHYGITVDWRALETSGQALVDMMEVMAREPRKMSAHGLQQLRQAMESHVLNAHRGGVHMLPKHHMETCLLFCER